MKTKSRKPELVVPAGDWPSLHAAIEAGADSVYFGLKTLNMRNLARNFNVNELPKIMKTLRAAGKKGFLALNTIVMNSELAKLEKIMHAAKRAKVDAVILWDMAALRLAKKTGLKIHISTQASVSNSEAIRFYSGAGAKRAVLARECSLKDIRQIASEIKRKRIPVEIETFVHGAMCVSVSGRCFLSELTFGKSANRGECLQPCRREYYVYDAEEGEAEYRVGKDYILSPKDLCMIENLDKLTAAGIRAFKIEGRMKSAEYVRVVTSAYRRGIDAVSEGNYTAKFKKELKKEIEKVYNRGFSTGFFFGHPQVEAAHDFKHTHEKIYAGKVVKYFKKIGVAHVKLLSCPLSTGDEVLFIGKRTPAREMTIAEMQQDHRPVKKALKGEEVGVKIPFEVKSGDKLFVWKERGLE